MLEKIFFPALRSLNYIYYFNNSNVILEQILKKQYKLFFCKHLYLPTAYFFYSSKLTKYYTYSMVVMWLKMIFRGKGYRMRKFKRFNKFTFNFGRSHWTKSTYDRNFFFCKKNAETKNFMFCSVFWVYDFRF